MIKGKMNLNCFTLKFYNEKAEMKYLQTIEKTSRRNYFLNAILIWLMITGFALYSVLHEDLSFGITNFVFSFILIFLYQFEKKNLVYI